MMKQKSYLTLLAIVFAGSFLVSNNAGVTTVQNKDRTGSPVGLTALCNNCHSGGVFTTMIELRMRDNLGNVVTTYDPGQTYNYEVEVTSTGASAYGFQSVGLIASTNANAGTLVALSSNTKTKVLSGRTYGEHTTRSNPGLFKMTWTAPAAGSGDVKFYACGLGCNANSSTSGDKFVKATALTLTEHVSTGVEEKEQVKFNLYPQPLNGTTLYVQGNYTGNGRVLISDMTGRIIQTENCIFAQGSVTGIDVSGLTIGTFILVVTNQEGQQVYSSVFIKQ